MRNECIIPWMNVGRSVWKDLELGKKHGVGIRSNVFFFSKFYTKNKFRFVV